MPKKRSLLNTLGALWMSAVLSCSALAEAMTSDELKRQEEAIASARQVMDDFMTAFNARDERAWAETFNYPHIRFASGTVRFSEDIAAVEQEMDFEKFAAATGWHHSAWDSIELVQAGKDKVHFDVSFTRYDAAGSKLKTYQSLYIVTLREGHWGIQARSSFAP